MSLDHDECPLVHAQFAGEEKLPHPVRQEVNDGRSVAGQSAGDAEVREDHALRAGVILVADKCQPERDAESSNDGRRAVPFADDDGRLLDAVRPQARAPRAAADVEPAAQDRDEAGKGAQRDQRFYGTPSDLPLD